MKNMIDKYERLGIKIWVENNKVKFSGPVKLIDKEFLSFFQNNQHELLKYFSNRHLDSCDILASKNQMALWIDRKMGNKSGTVHNGMIKSFNGNLVVDKVKAAFDKILDRHDVLKCTFYELKNEVYLKISEINDSYFSFNKSYNADESEPLKFVKNEISKTLDLSDGPLFKVMVYEFSANKYYIAFWVHHIISDAYSLFVIENEFYKYYDELLNGRKHTFADIQPDVTCIEDEVNYFNGQQYKDDLSFWKSNLNPEISGTTLPKYKIEKDTENKYIAKTITINFPREVSQNINTFCKEYHFTPYILFFSVFSLLLGYANEDNNISLGLFAANRLTEQQINQVGYFSNSLVFQMDFNNDQVFVDYVAEVKKIILKALSHQHMPFTELVEKINPVRSNGMPFFNVAFDSLLFPADTDKDELQNRLEFNDVALIKGAGNYDLIVWLSSVNDCYSLEYRYNKYFFDEFQIEGLAESIKGLLNNLSSIKTQRLSDVPLLYGKHTELLNSINNTKVDITENDVFSCVKSQCDIYKDHLAIDYYGNVLSYDDLGKMIDLISNKLRAEGIGKGDYVGVMLNKSQYFLPIILAIWSVGSVYVPIDPNYPENRKEFIISNTKLNAIIQEKGICSNHSAAIIYVENIAEMWLNNKNSDLSYNYHYNPLDQSMPAYVLYTSGSTGIPKGVVISHRSLINFLVYLRQKIKMNKNDKMLAITSICFDISFLEMFLPLISGAEVVMLSYEDSMSGRELYSNIITKSVNAMQATPSTFEILFEYYSKQMCTSKIFDICICGGESYELNLVEKLQTMSDRVFNLYGPTETTVYSTIYEIPCPCNKLRLGAPIANTTIIIADKNGRQLPLGYPGELLIGGEGLMLGYYNNTELTNQVIIKTNEGCVFYKTGDWCYFSQNGELNFLGRKDNQVKIRGFRIEVSEIENVFRKNELVVNAAVVVLEANNSKELVAIVILKDGKTIDTESLKQFISAYLPSYMIPNHIFITNSFPMTNNNKIDRKYNF